MVMRQLLMDMPRVVDAWQRLDAKLKGTVLGA